MTLYTFLIQFLQSPQVTLVCFVLTEILVFLLIMPFKWGRKRIKSVLPTQSSSSETTSQNLVEVAGAVSQPEIVELSYEYTIPDLSLVAQKPGECVFSPIFFAKSHPGIQWRLIICPNGKNERSKGPLESLLGTSF